MYQAIARIMAGAKEGFSDTRVEFGTLKAYSPASIKLDEDPIALEAGEMVFMKEIVLKPEDVGSRFALIRCTNGQYLVLGEVV